jgi:hypothetical protein
MIRQNGNSARIPPGILRRTLGRGPEKDRPDYQGPKKKLHESPLS